MLLILIEIKTILFFSVVYGSIKSQYMDIRGSDFQKKLRVGPLPLVSNLNLQPGPFSIRNTLIDPDEDDYTGSFQVPRLDNGPIGIRNFQIPRLDNGPIGGRFETGFGGAKGRCDKRIRVFHGATRIRDKGTLARFQCAYGFHLIGVSVAVCVRGRWSDPPPICVREGCGRLLIPIHGTLRLLYGGAVGLFSCNYGFSISGNRMLTCDGQLWNGTSPSCIENAPMVMTPPSTTFPSLPNNLDVTEIVTTTIQPESETTTVQLESETTTVQLEPETTTVQSEPKTTTVQSEPKTTTVQPEPKITTVEPEPKTTTEETTTFTTTTIKEEILTTTAVEKIQETSTSIRTTSMLPMVNVSMAPMVNTSMAPMVNASMVPMVDNATVTYISTVESVIGYGNQSEVTTMKFPETTFIPVTDESSFVKFVPVPDKEFDTRNDTRDSDIISSNQSVSVSTTTETLNVTTILPEPESVNCSGLCSTTVELVITDSSEPNENIEIKQKQTNKTAVVDPTESTLTLTNEISGSRSTNSTIQKQEETTMIVISDNRTLNSIKAFESVTTEVSIDVASVVTSTATNISSSTVEYKVKITNPSSTVTYYNPNDIIMTPSIPVKFQTPTSRDKFQIDGNEKMKEYVAPSSSKLDVDPSHLAPSHLIVIAGTVLVTIGFISIVGGLLMYCWRKNKGIARRSASETDGRTLSFHEGNDELVWLDNNRL